MIVLQYPITFAHRVVLADQQQSLDVHLLCYTCVERV